MLQRRRLTGVLFVLPLAALMLAAYMAPLAQSWVGSFHPNTPAGIDSSVWTLENYARLFDEFYATVFIRTLRISLTITAISALLAYPVAIWISGLRPAAQMIVLVVYLAPWLVNPVVKSFGWGLLLANNGLINAGLQAAGLTSGPVRLMLNETGIVIALIPGHLLFVLLPLWSVLKGLDPNLKWAAGTLGARPWQVFARIVLPLTLPAFLAGLIINFTMNMAAFATPALLGGTRTRVLAYLAYQVNLEELNWPFGAALAVTLAGITLTLIAFAQILTRTPEARPAR